ncbi:MAG: polysaccharide deacetylase family protein [Gaiellaceae bacterium]|jgi:peptidoglycan/xylan/chitin deacetylase (PgdA/CDA1 family)
MRPGKIGLGALTAACAWCAPAPAPHLPALARRLGIHCRLPNLDGVALTFDDGPDPRTTPAVLELLEQARVTATFFLIGEQVERHGALAAEIAAAGHELGLHGYRHLPTLLRTPRGLDADLDRAEAVITAATGRRPVFYRPPFGVFSAAALLTTRRRGWTPLLWSRWGREWERGARAEMVARRASEDLESGDVILLHDASYYGLAGFADIAVKALPAILDVLSERELAAVAVSQPE